MSLTACISGDPVRALETLDPINGNPGIDKGHIYNVHSVNSRFVYLTQAPMSGWYHRRFELVSETKEGENEDMAELKDELQALELSPDDALLVKHGVINLTGKVTEEGKSAFWKYIVKGHKAELVADLKKIDAAVKASK